MPLWYISDDEMRSQGITGSYGYDRTKLPDSGMRSAARARRFDSDQHAARPRNFEDRRGRRTTLSGFIGYWGRDRKLTLWS
jgi:hypothetical protein